MKYRLSNLLLRDRQNSPELLFNLRRRRLLKAVGEIFSDPTSYLSGEALADINDPLELARANLLLKVAQMVLEHELQGLTVKDYQALKKTLEKAQFEGMSRVVSEELQEVSSCSSP